MALAKHYAQQGHRLVLVGRRDAGPPLSRQAIYCQADLSELDAAERITAVLIAHGIKQLDVVVQNAGVGYYGRFLDQPSPNIDELINVNLRAPIAISHALLPWLKAAKGQLVFISSVVSALPGPNYAVYAATKAALDGFARSLRIELRGQVTVQTVFPGATRTGMHAKMGVSSSEMNWERFPPAEATALRIANIISKKRHQGTIGVGNNLLRFAGLRLGWLVDPLVGRVRRKDKNINRPLLCAITGAADGIGKALALRFGQAGYAILGIDVDEKGAAKTREEMEAAGVKISFLLADLADRASLETAVSKLVDGPQIDIFIHNAGISAVGRFELIPLARQMAVLDLNFVAPLHISHRLLQANKLSSGGAWVFLSSLSHYVSYPGAAVYAASKDGLASIARSFRVASYITQHTTTIYPGPTRTAHARRYSPDNSREGQRMAPEELAEAIFNAVQKKRAIKLPGIGPKVFAAGGRLVPRLMEWAMKKTILDKVGNDVR